MKGGVITRGAPRPRVKVPPSWTLFIAREFSSAWASVFTAQNSTPCGVPPPYISTRQYLIYSVHREGMSVPWDYSEWSRPTDSTSNPLEIMRLTALPPPPPTPTTLIRASPPAEHHTSRMSWTGAQIGAPRPLHFRSVDRKCNDTKGRLRFVVTGKI